ncbi:MAG TPA: MFS transporter [Thermoplasmata archaeon]|nr:MFS transporter [Thermoplasmata archaeon]
MDHLALRTWPSRLVARRWLLAFVPINAATAGFGVVLPLLILIPLRGSWADVAVAATLYNAILIVASVVWGHLSDRYPFRRAFLVINYAAFAGLYGLLAEVHSLTVLYAIYAGIGAIAPAGVSASNLLILEKFTEGERPTAFASFQEVSMIGSLVGLGLGYVWTVGGGTLLVLLAVLAALALASAFLIQLWVAGGPGRLRTPSVARHSESLLSRLRPSSVGHSPVPFFPHRPRLGPQPLARLRRWVGEELHHELPLVMAASFLFNLSGNLFNISYTPYLYSVGLAASAIFLVNLGNNFAQTLVFPTTGGLANRVGIDRMVQRATYFRAIGYLATAGFTLVVLTRGASLGANLLVYGALGAAIAAYTTASTLMLYRGFAHRDAGGLLGINSALGGAAAVAGAGLSGLLAVFGSFRLVFLVSAGLLFVSVPLWAAASVAYERRRTAERAAGRSTTPPRASGGPVEGPAAAKAP